MLEPKERKKIELNKEKDLGLVTTPPKTAEYIISRLSPLENKRILDPCAGPGIFIKKLLEVGVQESQIQAFDINFDYKNQIEAMGVNFKKQDYLLSLSAFSYNEFDIILGNPPYLNKASQYVRKNKTKLHKIYGKINSHETYSMFIVNSIKRLKNGGKLGFITSDSFLTLNTHTKLRRFILSTCKIIEILLPSKNLFDDQNVSTSPAIIILEKLSGKENKKERLNNIVRAIPRITNEEEYLNPPKICEFKQERYHQLPFQIFFIDIEEEIIDLFANSSRLENHIKGDIGMHTRNNIEYIAAIAGTELAEIFRKRNESIQDQNKKYTIITKEELSSNRWKPYMKRGGGDQYYRQIMEAVDWREKSVKKYIIPKNVEFQKEGIIFSGVSSRLAVRYMPKGCYWDSNKAIGFYIIDHNISIEYALGLLNSSLYNYLMKGILNNTNSIQITGIHALPFIPPDNDTKKKIENLVRIIIDNKKKDNNYDYNKEQKKIDNHIFEFYKKRFNFKEDLKKKIHKYYSFY